MPCTYSTLTTLADCVAVISQQGLVAAPGTRFDYGNSHLHVAARMAEVATGSSWAALFETQELQTVLHLLGDDREIGGAGQSEFTRGACWLAPISKTERKGLE